MSRESWNDNHLKVKSSEMKLRELSRYGRECREREREARDLRIVPLLFNQVDIPIQ